MSFGNMTYEYAKTVVGNGFDSLLYAAYETLYSAGLLSNAFSGVSKEGHYLIFTIATFCVKGLVGRSLSQFSGCCGQGYSILNHIPACE